MPDSVIKKVEAYGTSTALPGIFDFADRNGILFKWNEVVDESPEGIVDIEDVVLYPSLAAEHPGVVLGTDQPLPSIEVELVPQGQAEDAAACNANIQPFDVAGVVAASIVHANVDELDDYKIDDDDGIITVREDIPQQPPHAPLVVNDTDNDDDATGSDDDDDDDDDVDVGENENDSLDEDDDEELVAAATDAQEGNESDSDQGVRRSRRRGKGTNKKYADYSLLMAARRARRGGQRRAFLRDGCVFFSSDDLSDAKPIPEEDRDEFALGVALVHYSMNAGLKKFKEKGEAGVTKELS